MVVVWGGWCSVCECNCCDVIDRVSLVLGWDWVGCVWYW